MPRLMPVPLPWRNKTFQIVGQSPMQFDYKGTQASGREGAIKVENVKNSVYTARKWMKKATGIVGADVQHWPDHVKKAYKLYFKNSPRPGGRLDSVRAVMQATRAGLGNPMVIAAICRLPLEESLGLWSIADPLEGGVDVGDGACKGHRGVFGSVTC